MTSARLTHITSNGLGNDPTARPTPDFLQAARNRREVIINTIRFFEEDGDLVAADASRRALAELERTISQLENAQ
jgi:hypothetical protein